MRVEDEAMLDENRAVEPGADSGGVQNEAEKHGLKNEEFDVVMEASLNALRDERDSYLAQAQRERADFDNYRKRIEREMKDLKRASLADFLKDFFGPLDDMDRVLEESDKPQSLETFANGVRIMQENFWRTLAKAGVKKIDARGKPFDPNFHEAITAVPSAEVKPDTVLEVIDNGYKLDDFVLRPAKVIVSRKPDETDGA
ncbi:MAG: nucleotide exchange factor GrpE [Planctomycetes bacterium]|nr:nucleotide exchange factor GrpE [Planctomycetota bacterium]